MWERSADPYSWLAVTFEVVHWEWVWPSGLLETFTTRLQVPLASLGNVFAGGWLLLKNFWC
jgi:hypothetical protein